MKSALSMGGKRYILRSNETGATQTSLHFNAVAMKLQTVLGDRDEGDGEKQKRKKNRVRNEIHSENNNCLLYEEYDFKRINK